MSPKKFIDLVYKMRSAQNQYFRTRSLADLDKSKILERQVDNALWFFSQPANQPTLFPLDGSR